MNKAKIPTSFETCEADSEVMITCKSCLGDFEQLNNERLCVKCAEAKAEEEAAQVQVQIQAAQRESCYVCGEIDREGHCERALMVVLRGPFVEPRTFIRLGHSYLIHLKCIRKLHIDDGVVTEFYADVRGIEPGKNLADTLNKPVT